MAPVLAMPPRQAVALQALDLTSLRAVVAELRPLLLPSRFEKAQQADGQTLQLALRHLHGVQWIELSWLAEAPRLLAVDPPPRQGEGSTLAQQLQHGLRGLALVTIEQPGWERVVELGFAPRPGDAVQRTLVLELMGRHSNLFLLEESRRVVALGRQVRAGQSRLRPIGTGDPYEPPPPLRGRCPSRDESMASWQHQLGLVPLTLQQALLQSYQGVSPALCRQLVADLLPPGAPAEALLQAPLATLTAAQWQRLHQQWQHWLSALEASHFQFCQTADGGFRCWGPAHDVEESHQAGPTGSGTGSVLPVAAAPPSTCVPSGAAPGAPLAPGAWRQQLSARSRETLPLNTALARYYGRHLGQRRRRQQHQALGQRLEQALARERRLLAQQQTLLAAAAGSDALQQEADALLCQPALPREDVAAAQKLYQRARKLRRSVAAISPRLAEHQQRLEALETSLLFLEQAGPDQALPALEEELVALLGDRRPGRNTEAPAQRRRQKRSTADADPQPLELLAPSGLRLQVGRNHRQNAWISLQQARRGDLWFHAQEVPGSHVVLKASEGVVQEADLALAADLAAYFSRARGNRRVPVVLVPCDQLQRIPGAVIGTVRHRGGEILWGEPERARPWLASADPDAAVCP